MNKKQLLLITLLASSQATLSLSKAAAMTGAFVATAYGNQAKQAALEGAKEAKDFYAKFKASLGNDSEIEALKEDLFALKKQIQELAAKNKALEDIDEINNDPKTEPVTTE